MLAAGFFVGLFTFLWTGAYMSLSGMDSPRKPRGGKGVRGGQMVPVYVTVKGE